MTDDEKVRTAKVMRRTRDNVQRLWTKIAALPDFLSRGNLLDLERWSADPDCPISVRIRVGISSVGFYAERKHLFDIDLGPQNNVPSLADF